ncbi:MAG: MotA/TolQ/ExbB proton channel family protein [Magnetococcus sp. DMHC-1]|nr:MotA/TolQ/ExbB proton channel family protein [Magnetococcales bacterium]
MDVATIVGLLAGLGLISWAILIGGTFAMFIDIPSVLITCGGTVCAMFVRHKLSEIANVAAVTAKVFVVKEQSLEKVISQLVDLANIARKDGILALEKVKASDPFLQSAITYCVDGADPEFLADVLNKEVDALAQRHAKGIAFMEGVAEFGPAFGMIGTLIGLVQMLANMQDASKIGPAMAVALITTFYGALMANLIASPIATKLSSYSAEEQKVRKVIIDGMLGIQKGLNPRLLQEALLTALPPKQREL